MLLIGSLALLNGMRMLKGAGKSWYFSRHLYAGGVYAQMPMGVGFLLFAIASLLRFSPISSLLVDVGIGLLVLGVVFNFLRPSFLKPAWLRRLERKHGDIMHLLESEAHEMGLGTWENYVETHGLETWVAGVRSKYELE